jgi:Phosphotransferase system mannitol/fructose-specific IIA domain (Ntr-type)
VLELASEFIAHESELDSEDVYHALIDRERLRSTRLIRVAIPHCRLPDLEKPIPWIFDSTESSVDFDAIDSHPLITIYIVVPQSPIKCT